MITFFLGWWGVISFFVALACLLSNIGVYLMFLVRGTPTMAAGTSLSYLSEEIEERVHVFDQELIQRVSQGEDLGQVAEDIAARAGVTVDAVVAYYKVRAPR